MQHEHTVHHRHPHPQHHDHEPPVTSGEIAQWVYLAALIVFGSVAGLGILWNFMH